MNNICIYNTWMETVDGNTFSVGNKKIIISVQLVVIKIFAALPSLIMSGAR